MLELPFRTFMFMSDQIDRLKAYDGLELLKIAAFSQSQEGYTQAYENMQSVVGEIYKFAEPESDVDPDTGLDPEFDREGLHSLMML